MAKKKIKINHFMFRPFGEKYLITNDFGRYMFVDKESFDDLINQKVDLSTSVGKELFEKGFIYDDSIRDELISLKREKWSYILRGPVLHIVILTLRCNHACQYCHASRAPMEAVEYDMSMAIADKVVENIFKSPTDTLTIEFQGGEPLVNWDVLVHIVNRSKELIKETNKNVMFALVSNLSLMDDEKLDFLVKNHVQISTSLDGPKDLHNKHRRMNNGDSYEEVVKWIHRINQAYKEHGMEDIVYRVEALPTITRDHLKRHKDLIDEYLSHGMKTIFLRPINPFGFAVNTAKAIGYTPEEFLEFYRNALNYIIDLNKQGIELIERFAAIFLTKILKPDDPNFLDIRSPCGAGIGQMAYNYDGKVYTCDEGRMVARMGDEAFNIGDVRYNSYNEIVTHPTTRALVTASTLEALAGCAECAYRPYCGTCPVFNYRTQGSIFPVQTTNEKCKLHMGILNMLFEKLYEGDPEVMEIFNRWVSVRERPEYFVHQDLQTLKS